MGLSPEDLIILQFEFEEAFVENVERRRIFLKYKRGMHGEARLVNHVLQSQIATGLVVDAFVHQSSIPILWGVYSRGIGVIADNTEKYRRDKSMPHELIDNLKGRLYSGP